MGTEEAGEFPSLLVRTLTLHRENQGLCDFELEEVDSSLHVRGKSRCFMAQVKMKECSNSSVTWPRLQNTKETVSGESC